MNQSFSRPCRMGLTAGSLWLATCLCGGSSALADDPALPNAGDVQ